ncbi:MAG: hypothetical protein JW716_02955 [Candidatus Aenigmarchaeota archaeon]|nr:hypothetical protein [Candidatus Aenigmarchaeota archaeon]
MNSNSILLVRLLILSTFILYLGLSNPVKAEDIIYNITEHDSSLSSYVRWSSDIRTLYPRNREPIGYGRGGYYWEYEDNVEIGWCSESLCNDVGINGAEIFDFFLYSNSRENCTIKIHTFTPSSRVWYQQVKFDIFVNNEFIGYTESAPKGLEKISYVDFDCNVLKMVQITFS